LKTQTDITVIGAGPCGSFAAFKAAKLGANVTVLEEHEEIGVPTHCTGHISLFGLKTLGLHLPKNMVQNMFRSAIFYSPSGKNFSVKFGSPMTCVIDRALFDKYLAKLAANFGVKYQLNSKATSFVREKVVVVHKGKKEELTSKIVIDAEGVPPFLLRNIGWKIPNSRMWVNAVQAHVDKVENMDENCVELYFGRKFASGFFAWIVPLRDGEAKVGLATNSGNPKLCLQKFMQKTPIANQKLKKSRIEKIFYHLIPLGGPIPKTYGHNLLIVGDAASQVKPSTGGGIITGLSCAKIAGEIAFAALQHGDFSENFLSQYEERWRKAIGFQLNLLLKLRKMFNRLSDRKIDQIIELCQRFNVGECLSKVEDVDFLKKTLPSLMKNPQIFTVATYFFLSSLVNV